MGKWKFVDAESGYDAFYYDIEFLEDGIFIINSPFLLINSYEYEILSDNQIKLSAGMFTEILEYSREENKLYLYFDGGHNQYTKEGEQSKTSSYIELDKSNEMDDKMMISPKDEMKMLFVPEGEFFMGSDDEAVIEAIEQCSISYSDTCGDEMYYYEQPRHAVFLDGFWIDQTEISNVQYKKCVSEGVCSAPSALSSQTRKEYYLVKKFDDYPVINISWEQAKTYCEWAGRRLPSEAEWEKAARGVDGRLYPWGNDFKGDVLNFCDVNCPHSGVIHFSDWDDGYSDTAPVNEYPDGISPYGVFNMAGNVAEWVSDWLNFDYYSISPYENPQVVQSPPLTELQVKIIRGGAFFDPPVGVRTTDRIRYQPKDISMDWVGFRCVFTQ